MRVSNKFIPTRVQTAIDCLESSYTALSMMATDVDTVFVSSSGRRVKATMSKLYTITYLCRGLDLRIAVPAGPGDVCIVPYSRIQKDFNHLWKI
jgi:hypothetical protein